jgi:uncharacterized protein YkwD
VNPDGSAARQRAHAERDDSAVDSARRSWATNRATRHRAKRKLRGVFSALWRPRTYLVIGLAVIAIAGTVGTGYAPLDQPAADIVSSTLKFGSAIVGGFASGVADASTVNESEIRQELHAEVNERRTERGLAPLDRSQQLDRVAEYHSEDMTNNSYFAHTAPDGETLEERYASRGIGCAGGENIWRTTDSAAATDEQEFAETVVDSWMNSPGHRENILQPRFSSEGFGIATGPYAGEENVMVTQNFC